MNINTDLLEEVKRVKFEVESGISQPKLGTNINKGKTVEEALPMNAWFTYIKEQLRIKNPKGLVDMK